MDLPECLRYLGPGVVFEPLLEGQSQRDAEFDTPALGVPRDLYTIDWSRVPKAQRSWTWHPRC